MTYRSFDTGTWKDPWFEQLSIKAKLLFIYLWTNDTCSQSGVYHVSTRRVEFESGLKATEILPELDPKVKWFEEESIVWVKNFFRKQCQNPKFAICAVKSLSSIPKTIVEEFTQYNEKILTRMGIDTLSIPYRDPMDMVALSVTGSVTVTDNTTLAQKRSRLKGQSDATGGGFDSFWEAYPRKKSRMTAQRAWAKLNGSRPATDVIISKIEALKKSEQWMKDGGKFIPYPATWLNSGGWDDEIVVMKTSGEKPGPRHKVFDPEKDFAEMRRREQERWKKDEAKK
jgi:hypothetical protein